MSNSRTLIRRQTDYWAKRREKRGGTEIGRKHTPGRRVLAEEWLFNTFITHHATKGVRSRAFPRHLFDTPEKRGIYRELFATRTRMAYGGRGARFVPEGHYPSPAGRNAHHA